MPLGSIVHETGLLYYSQSGLLLNSDIGGSWKIERSRAANRLVGQRVELEGIRTGFDELAPKRIWKAGMPRPSRALSQLIFPIEVTLVGLSLLLILFSSLM